MADNSEQQNSASVPVPSDNEIPYVFNALGKPSLADPGFSMPGHKKADPTAISAAAAARFQAEVAAANAKRDATFRRDTAASQDQHPQVKANFKPAPRKGR